MAVRAWLVVVGVCLRSARVECSDTTPTAPTAPTDPTAPTTAPPAPGATTDQTDARIAQLEADQKDLMHQIQDALTEDLVPEELQSQRYGDDETQPAGGRRSDSKSKKKLNQVFYVDNLYSKKDRGKKKWKDRMEHKAEIQGRLDKWLEQRKAERDKIMLYKERERKSSQKKERCPKEGRRYKKDWSRRRGRGRGRARGEGIKYPCCRKCCKRSYMGCL